MGMKFLNKKGWHTGSLRNIENVWKAEQKHEAEQKKLEELRKQIHEEREKSEFRLLQEQAGLIPKQERLDFLYDSGLAVGKKDSEGFKSLESLPKPVEPAASSSKQQSIVPGGALFEEKPQSANDAWRKLHSDPLLLIRQREQEAIARVKNNPVQMAMIRKSVEEKKAKKRKEKSSRHKHESRRDVEDRSMEEEEVINRGDYRSSKNEDNSVRDNRETRRNSDRDTRYKERSLSDEKYEENSVRDSREKRRNSDRDSRRRERSPTDRPSENEKYEHNSKRRNSDMGSKYKERSPSDRPSANEKYEHNSKRKNPDNPDMDSKYERFPSDRRTSNEKYEHNSKRNSDRDSKCRERSPSGNSVRDSRENRRNSDKEQSASNQPTTTERSRIVRPQHHNSQNNRPKKLSDEERAARLREMQMDAEIHEELRWKRLKKAEEDDAKEIRRDNPGGRNFLDAAHKSVFGAEKGGSSTIEESVRRRTHYSQGRSQVSGETNAFRR